MTKFVTYNSDDEVLVMTKKSEKKALEIYFNKTTGRNLEDYERKILNDVAVGIEPRLSCWVG